MNIVVILLLSALMYSTANGSSSAVTRKGCYTFHDVDSTWNEARDACRAITAHLVTMETIYEWNKVKDFLKEKEGESGGYSHYYIGLRRESGEWKWDEEGSSGITVATYDSRWQSSQPSRTPYGEDCAEMSSYYRDEYGHFNNVECDVKYRATRRRDPRGYICEDL